MIISIIDLKIHKNMKNVIHTIFDLVMQSCNNISSIKSNGQPISLANCQFDCNIVEDDPLYLPPHEYGPTSVVISGASGCLDLSFLGRACWINHALPPLEGFHIIDGGKTNSGA